MTREKAPSSIYENEFYIDSITETTNATSNTHGVLEVKGNANIHHLLMAIKHAFNEDSFHYKFSYENGTLLKKYHYTDFEIPYYDFSDQKSPDALFRQKVESYYFDKMTIQSKHLFKACVCKISKDYLRVIIMIHHLCVDGTAFKFLLERIKNGYASLKVGEKLPTHSSTPIDFLLPTSQLNISEGISYFKKKLGHNSISSEFHTTSHPGHRRSMAELLSLDIDISNRIREYCRANTLTPNLLFKSLFAILIGRLSNQTLIGISSPVDMRDKTSRNRFGCFVNTVLNIYDLHPDQHISEFHGQVRRTNREVKKFLNIPYGELIRRLKKDADNPENISVNVSFGSTIGICECDYLDENVTFNFSYEFIELNSDVQLLFCENSSNRFSFRLDYLASFAVNGVFDRFLQRFRLALDFILTSNGSRLFDIPILLPEEFHFISTTNNTTTVIPDLSLAEIFHSWYKSTPEAIALVDAEAGFEYNYNQLYCKVSSLVDYLCSFAESHQSLPTVAIINFQSLTDTVVAIIATQYLGIAFTCVDNSAPEQRKLEIISLLSPVILLGDDIGGDSKYQQPIMRLPSLHNLIERSLPIKPLALAPKCVSQYIFTSGTTGTPKGVALSHRALISTIINSTKIPVSERILYSANEAFDAATLQLWSALLHGRTLIIPKRGTIANPDSLAALIATHKVDNLFLTTGLFETYMNNGKAYLFNKVSTLIFGGDSVSRQSVAKALEAGIPNLINIYGPTETSIYVCSHRCKFQDIEQVAIPVGRPSDNSKVFIVDDFNRLLPKGALGHVLIAGEGLANGYIGKPELTKSKFKTIALRTSSTDEDVAVYLSGDYAYWGRCNNLFLCGRKDEQIKLRGYRIELSEIRTAIEKCSGVKMAVVLLREKGAAKNLVAYFVGDGIQSVENIKAELIAVLPNYMIPTFIIELSHLPLTPNGKINRHALPDPVLESAESTFPLSTIQQALLKHAALVLDRPYIRLDEDFVSLGGDSISAITLSVEMEMNGYCLNTSDIMDNRRFADMALFVEVKEMQFVDAGMKSGTFSLLPAQKWFFEQSFPVPEHFNQAFLLKVPEPLTPHRLNNALKLLTTYHDTFQLKFFAGLQHFNYENTHNFELHTPAFDALSELYSYIDILNRSFNLESGPLFKVVYITADEKYYIYLCAHHLIVDGVSWRTIISDLQNFYYHGEDAVLPKYSNTQRYVEALSEQIHLISDKEIKHWMNFSLTHESSLRSDRVASGEKLQSTTITLSSEQTETLMTIANHAYRTQGHELLLIALAKTLAPDQPFLDILLEGHGRQQYGNHIRCEATVGWFTSIYPVRISSGHDTMRSRIKDVKEQLRRVPEKGANFLNLAWCHSDEAVKAHLKSLLLIPVSFNFLGIFRTEGDNGWIIENINGSALVNSRNKPLRTFDINCWIIDERLTIQIDLAHNGVGVNEIAQVFLTEIDLVVNHCVGELQQGGLTPSDLKSCTLTQNNIEQLEGKLGALDNIYPATDFQRELMYFNKINPDYQIDQLYFKLHGFLDLEAFRSAWGYALKRHDMLRAGFEDSFSYGCPLAVIPKEATLPILFESWRDISENIEEELMLAILSERAKPFDFMSPPLMRLFLSEISDQLHYMIFTFNHILFDGWSMQIFLSEILRDYQCIMQGRTISLSPYSFEPFCRHLREASMLPGAKDFWESYLAGAPRNMRIQSAKHHINATTELRVQCKSHMLSEIETQEFIARCQALHVTPNELCQLAWARTLGEMTHSNDVVFGTTLTKRPAKIPEVTALVGLFVATPPLRVRLQGDLREELKQISCFRNERTEYAFFDLNYYDSQLRPDSPFGTLFVFENYPQQTKESTNITLKLEHIGTTSGTNHQIVVCIFPGQNMAFNLFYDQTEISESIAIDISTNYKQELLNLCHIDITEAVV